jgi:hypothetical protein
MKASAFTAAALLAAALAACSGPKSRIREHQAEFDAYPPAVQRKIRAGQVEVGFSPRQVALALGRPDRIFTRKTAAVDQEVWSYGVGETSVGFGVGFGGGPVGIGVAASPPVERGARMRVVFQNDVVVSIESRGY